MVSMFLRPPLLLPSACLAADLSCIQLVSSPANATCFGAADEAAEAHRGLDLLREGRAYCRQAPLTNSQPVQKVKLKKVRPDEIMVVKTDANFMRLHGDTYDILQRLKSDEMLGDPRNTSQESRILEGIVFTRRKKGVNTVWTFHKSDIGKVAALLGIGYDSVLLKKIQPNDIKVTVHDAEFTRFQGNTPGLARRMNSDEMLGDPNKAEVETRILKGIVFTRRRNRTCTVWTFHKSDIGKVAALLGVGYDRVLLKKVQPDEIRVAYTDAEFTRLHGNTLPLAKRLNSDDMLGDPNKTEEETKIFKGIVFTKRRNVSSRVWTFNRSDIGKVAALLGVGYDRVLLKKVQPDEIRVTHTDAKFARLNVDTEYIAQRLKSDDMLGDPDKAEEETKTLKGIVFTRRKNGVHKAWTFHRSDIDKVAALLGVGYDRVLLKKVQPDEVRVSKYDSDFARLHGDTIHIALQLNSVEMLGDPNKAEEETKILKGILFTRRRSGAHRVWTFHKSNIAKVAALLGVGYDEAILKDVQPNEIRITFYDAEFTRFHGNTTILAKRLNGYEILGDPDEASEESKTIEGITFTRRASGRRRVWTFSRSDIYRVADLLGVGCDKVLLKKIQPDEIKVTERNPSLARLPGNARDYAHRLKGDDLLGDPEKASEESRTLFGIVFTRRLVSSSKVWTFRSADLHKLERALTKLGIINVKKIYGWHKRDGLKGLKNKDVEALRNELIFFDSNEERQVALMLQRYGFIKDLETGRNLQVEMLRGLRFFADFVLKTESTDAASTIVLEHHPDYLEDKLDLNFRERAFLKVLGEVDDDQLIEGLLDYYSGDLEAKPKDSATRMFLGGYLGTGELDFYDLRRMAMIHASPLFDEFTRYARTRKVDDLFDQLIWPLYYESKGNMTRSEARQEFEEAVLETKAKTERFDATVLPMIFEGDEDVDSETGPTGEQYAQRG